MNANEIVNMIQTQILELRQECYGGVEVTEEQALERARNITQALVGKAVVLPRYWDGLVTLRHADGSAERVEIPGERLPDELVLQDPDRLGGTRTYRRNDQAQGLGDVTVVRVRYDEVA